MIDKTQTNRKDNQMTFSEVLIKLGIKQDVSPLEKYFGTDTVQLCDEQNILALEAEYSVFGKYTKPLLECLEQVKKNEALCAYGEAISTYMAVEHTRIFVPMPNEADYDAPLSFFRLLVLAATLPHGIKKYKERGFSDEEIKNLLRGSFESRILLSEQMAGKSGLDESGYIYLALFTTAEVFRAGIFNVTPKNEKLPVIVLKNESTGELSILMNGVKCHRSGMILGSYGYTDEDGSFTPVVTETEDAFIGHPVLDNLASPELKSFDKKNWRKVFGENDGYAGIHIPRGADLSSDNVREGFLEALSLSKERYPERAPKAVYCSSWMISPELCDMLGESSKIYGFIHEFTKYPKLSSGREIFTFVFPGSHGSYAELPETTSLQRKLKKLYLDGGAIHAFEGFAVIE